jgi:hypothetical protein
MDKAKRIAAIASAIEAQDVEALKAFAFGRPCACQGALEGEPKCQCLMMAEEVREHILPAALRYGVIKRVARDRS